MRCPCHSVLSRNVCLFVQTSAMFFVGVVRTVLGMETLLCISSSYFLTRKLLAKSSKLVYSMSTTHKKIFPTMHM